MEKEHPIFFDGEMKSYFNTLPLVVQEAVFQSGVKLSTLQELQDFAHKYTTQ